MWRPSLIGIIVLLGALAAHGKCPIDTLTVKGQVESPGRGTRVHVRLVYAKNRPAETAEAILTSEGTFNIPVEFFTQSRRGIVGEVGERCEREPDGVDVSVTQDGKPQPIDTVRLSLKRDFKAKDPGEYILRSELVLNRPR
jgi:hypothetical protein